MIKISACVILTINRDKKKGCPNSRDCYSRFRLVLQMTQKDWNILHKKKEFRTHKKTRDTFFYSDKHDKITVTHKILMVTNEIVT